MPLYQKHTWKDGEIITDDKLNNMENGIDNALSKDTAQADYVSHEYLIENYDTTGDLQTKFDNRYIMLEKKFPNLTIKYWGNNSISYNAKAEKSLDLSKVTGQSILYGDDQLNQPEVQQKTIYDVLTNLTSRIEELENKLK